MFCPPVGSRVRSQNLCRNTQRGSICTVSFNGNTWERQEVQDDCRKTVLIPFMKPDSESLLNTENRTRVRGGGVRHACTESELQITSSCVTSRVGLTNSWECSLTSDTTLIGCHFIFTSEFLDS